MSKIECCNCGTPIEGGCYNTPIGIYCCDCYDDGGKTLVMEHYRKQPVMTMAYGRLISDTLSMEPRSKRPKAPKRYRFVKVKRGNETSGWYFVASNKDDITVHFEKYVGTEIREGVRDFIESDVEHRHLRTHFASAIAQTLEMKERAMIQDSPCNVALTLENETYRQRLDAVKKGKLLLTQGVQWCNLSPETIVEDVTREAFLFPDENTPTKEDIHIKIWPGGTHYYAKIGRYDVQDEDGAVKWFTPEEAMTHAMNTLKKLQQTV